MKDNEAERRKNKPCDSRLHFSPTFVSAADLLNGPRRAEDRLA